MLLNAWSAVNNACALHVNIDTDTHEERLGCELDKGKRFRDIYYGYKHIPCTSSRSADL